MNNNIEEIDADAEKYEKFLAAFNKLARIVHRKKIGRTDIRMATKALANAAFAWGVDISKHRAISTAQSSKERHAI